MSILTKEQMNTVENMRNDMDSILPLNDNSLSSDDSIIAYQAALNLLEVIDDLQARHIERKQYTENELYDIWLKAPGSETGDDPVSWDGALWAAKFLGALKAEP